MKRSTVTWLIAALPFVACKETSNPPPPAPTFSVPTVTPAPASASASTTDSDAASATTGANASDASGDAAIGAIGPGDTDGGAAAQFRACKVDADCVAVPKVGCCHNGWKEAVAVTQQDAYAKSFTCPEPHPICPMILVNDQRIALCENKTRLCTMFKPEDIPCGGFIANQHKCPSGYRCAVAPVPDVGGKCVK